MTVEIGGKSALVTGAHGFMGRHIARNLAKNGFLVTGIGHGAWAKDEYSKFGLKFWYSGEVDLHSLINHSDQYDLIVHCAGGGSVPFSMKCPYADYSRTVSSTAAVLEYARLYAPNSVIIYPSSAAVYGSVERLPINEADMLQPTSPYGAHKKMAEELCQLYGRVYKLKISIVRFFSVYGEGLKKQLLWDACSKAARGTSSFFGTGLDIRDWLHVDDAANLVGKLLQYASSSCPVFNGGCGVGTSTREVLQMIYKAYGLPLALEFSGKNRPGDPIGYQADIFKIANLGWRPSVDLHDGIERYVKWFKETQL